MNSKDVLKKIMTLLSIDKEVNFTEAKSANGDILSSPTFDLNEAVDVVHEDGTKSPAPDGEYTISLKDESGNENIIRIEVKDGKVDSRENVEEDKNEEEMADADAEKVKETPLPGSPSKVNDVEDSNITFPPKGGPSSHLSKVELENAEGPLGAHPETDSVDKLPSTEDKETEMSIGDVKEQLIQLAYRITELESKIGDLTDKKEISKEPPFTKEENVKFNLDDASEDELPKLDGAPVEMGMAFTPEEIQKRYGKKVQNSQSSFLSKLYK